MVVKVFDVAQGSCNLIITRTGKTELVDCGCANGWSPVDHVYRTYVRQGADLNRLVLSHHHGDHISDWDSFGARRPELVQRRPLQGEYLNAVRNSNVSDSFKLIQKFESAFSTYTRQPSPSEIHSDTWGVSINYYWLTVEEAITVSTTDNSLVNNCSFVRLYDDAGTKFLMPGDIEADGMELLLRKYPDFRALVAGTHVLLAPHHGHTSGFSTELMRAIGKPAVVIASVGSGNDNVDSRYSSADFVAGIRDSVNNVYRLVTTRSSGAITVETTGNGGFTVWQQAR